jgi:hypothetical protein
VRGPVGCAVSPTDMAVSGDPIASQESPAGEGLWLAKPREKQIGLKGPGIDIAFEVS